MLISNEFIFRGFHSPWHQQPLVELVTAVSPSPTAWQPINGTICSWENCSDRALLIVVKGQPMSHANFQRIYLQRHFPWHQQPLSELVCVGLSLWYSILTDCCATFISIDILRYFRWNEQRHLQHIYIQHSSQCRLLPAILTERNEPRHTFFSW